MPGRALITGARRMPCAPIKTIKTTTPLISLIRARQVLIAPGKASACPRNTSGKKRLGERMAEPIPGGGLALMELALIAKIAEMPTRILLDEVRRRLAILMV